MFLPRQPMDTAPKDRKILLDLGGNDYLVAKYEEWDRANELTSVPMWETGPGEGWGFNRPGLLGWWELPNSALADSYSMADAVNRHMQAIIPLCKIKGYAAFALAVYIMVNPDGTLAPESGITATTEQGGVNPKERDLIIEKMRQILDGLS